MQLEGVRAIVRSFAEHHLSYFVFGGWAMEALRGEQTREHRNLDIVVSEGRFAALKSDLADEGWTRHEYAARFQRLVHAKHGELAVRLLRFKDEAFCVKYPDREPIAYSSALRYCRHSEHGDTYFPTHLLAKPTRGKLAWLPLLPREVLYFDRTHYPHADDRELAHALKRVSKRHLSQIFFVPVGVDVSLPRPAPK